MSIKKEDLTEKEQLLAAIADQIEVLQCSEKESKKIFDKFAPEGVPTGLNFSKSYKPFITGFSKKYYILEMLTGATDFTNTRGVTTWCETIFKFKNKIEFENYMDFLRLYVNKTNNHRLTMDE